MGRPRKTVVVAAAPFPAPVAEIAAVDGKPAAIFFDDAEDDVDAELQEGGEEASQQVHIPTPAPIAASTTTAAAPPAADFNAFIREMQMLRQVMVQQRDEIDQLKSSLFKNQQDRVAEQAAALGMHETIQQLSEQLSTARSTPPVFVTAKELLPPPAPLQREASYYATPAFRTTPPPLPRQATRATPAQSITVPETKTGGPHARLGLIGDLPNTRKSRQNHVAELQTGSRYVVKGTNGLS